MEHVQYHLDQTIDLLAGPSKEQIKVFNQWAATALDKYHENSTVSFNFKIDGIEKSFILRWNSDFSKDAMKERRKIAEEAAISITMFLMSVLLEYHYVCQTEIGEGVDYRFQKQRPSIENFLQGSHYVEISGLLEESPSNTISERIK
jgi:hypothetical protein